MKLNETSKPRILVTGATGKTGGAVVARLLQKGYPVRAVVRKNDARSQKLQQAGAEVVVADMYDTEQMTAALMGIQRAYFLPPVQPFMIHTASVFAVAAREVGLEHIVGISQWIASPEHPALHTRQQWLVENLFSMIPGVGYTIVNPGVFAEPFLQFLPVAAQLGMYPNPFGGFINAPPSNEDMAKVIVGCLLDPDKHAGKRYRPTGPQLLTVPDIAGIIGKVLGREVKVQDVPTKMFIKAARASGLNIFDITITQHYIEDAKLNAFEVNAPTTDVFDVSGEHPETFETTARRYAAIMPGVTQSPANRFKAIGEAIKMVLTPPYDLDRYDREQQHPQAVNPTFASNSERWLQEHRTNGHTPLDVEMFTSNKRIATVIK